MARNAKPKIEPSQIIRINFEEIKCPFWDSIVKPQKKQVEPNP